MNLKQLTTLAKQHQPNQHDINKVLRIVSRAEDRFEQDRIRKKPTIDFRYNI